jgi:hypothetical protein
MKWRPALARLATLALLAVFAFSAQAQTSETQFPIGSRLGLKPPPGMASSSTFPGFEDSTNNAFIRVVALPDKAFAEIEKTMTNDALKKQGLKVEKRESLALASGRALLLITRQDASGTRIRKWLLIAPMGEVTALVSFEIPNEAKQAYADSVIRTALTSVTARATVPDEEQLALVPFKLSELGGFRLAGIIPGHAVQLTDGPKDSVEPDQAHLVVGVAPGGPPQPAERDSFARLALAGLPNLKELRIVGSESMRIAGQQGHEIRAEAKDPKTGGDVEIVQWLRFGSGAYLRIVGFAPKGNWLAVYPRFRAVRDGLEPR